MCTNSENVAWNGKPGRRDTAMEDDEKLLSMHQALEDENSKLRSQLEKMQSAQGTFFPTSSHQARAALY